MRLPPHRIRKLCNATGLHKSKCVVLHCINNFVDIRKETKEKTYYITTVQSRMPKSLSIIGTSFLRQQSTALMAALRALAALGEQNVPL
jgi:hypothetical protein